MEGYVGLGYVVRQFTGPEAVTHPTTNRAQCSATALIETNPLPLHYTNRHLGYLVSRPKIGQFLLRDADMHSAYLLRQRGWVAG